MMNRREFLISSTLAAAELTAFQMASAKPVSPNSKLNHACIGVGGMGFGDLNSLKSHPGTKIVALCDVDKNTLARAAKLIPGARTYTDWREMFAAEGDKIDSVNVSVPDHNHALIAANAIRLGKHVYCQKPLCHEVADCRMLRNLAKEKGIVSQLGIQFSAIKGDRMAVAYMQSGALGAIRHVYLFSTRQGVSRLDMLRPEKSDPVPPSLNWDIWLGTAEYRPYVNRIYHPTLWRIWQDFGSGWVGDNGCHMHNSSWQALGLSAPLTIRAEVQESWKNNPEKRKQSWPKGAHIVWEHAGTPTTGGEPLTVEWFDGFSSDPKTPANLLPPAKLTEVARKLGLSKLPEEGSVVEGTDGWLVMAHANAPRIVMKKEGAALPQRPKLADIPTHYHEFLNACREGRPATADFEKSVPLVESILLANVAERVPETTLQWDAAAMRVKNADDANRLLRRTYRKGWEL